MKVILVNYKIENPNKMKYLKNIEIFHNKQFFDIKKLFKKK